MIEPINNFYSTKDINPFLSLDSLRVAHRDLLRDYREHENESEIIPNIESLILKGRATGKLLDNEDDRWAAQSLLDYWSSLLYRAGYEPPDVTLLDFDPSLSPNLSDELCPYLGLDKFQSENQHLFFGRQHLIKKLLSHLETHRLLILVGSSGSGKSSVVLGGLLPQLMNGELPNSQDWVYYEPIVPGSDPLVNLSRKLQLESTAETAWISRQVLALQEDEHYLTQIIRERHATPVVLVIDQFEEVFTLCREDKLQKAFIDNLLNFANDPEIQNHLVLTLRTDYESSLTRIPKLATQLEECRISTTPLNASELREAIEKPAELVGLKFEEGLVDALLKDVLGEPTALPLLQFTLLKLWNHRDHNRLTWEAYNKLGGGRYALANSASEFYENLIFEDQLTVKRIFLQMVHPTEGWEITSRRILRRDLYLAGEARDRVDRVLENLIQARLIHLTEGDTPKDDQVEIAHEALIRNWPQLVEWIDKERERMRQRSHLSVMAKRWRAKGRDPSVLLSGSELEEALQFHDLTTLELDFIQASSSQCPFSEALEAWVASNQQDDSRLLRGQALSEALEWAKDQNLDKLSNSFLHASQQLEDRENKRQLELEKERNRILKETTRQAQKNLIQAEQKVQDLNKELEGLSQQKEILEEANHQTQINLSHAEHNLRWIRRLTIATVFVLVVSILGSILYYKYKFSILKDIQASKEKLANIKFQVESLMHAMNAVNKSRNVSLIFPEAKEAKDQLQKALRSVREIQFLEREGINFLAARQEKLIVGIESPYRLEIWDWNGKTIDTFPIDNDNRVVDVDISAEGVVVIGYLNGKIDMCYVPETDQCEEIYKANQLKRTQDLIDVKISNNGQTIIAVFQNIEGSQPEVKAWRIVNEKPENILLNDKFLTKLQGIENSLKFASVSGDGMHVIFYSEDGRSYSLYYGHIENNHLLYGKKQSLNFRLTDIALTFDGDTVYGAQKRSHKIILLKRTEREPIYGPVLLNDDEKNFNPITALRLSPDQGALIGAKEDGSVTYYPLGNFPYFSDRGGIFFVGQPDGITAFDFDIDRDQEIFVSVGKSGVRLWSMSGFPGKANEIPTDNGTDSEELLTNACQHLEGHSKLTNPDSDIAEIAKKICSNFLSNH